MILRDSWKDKTASCENGGCSKVLGKENHIGNAMDSTDYVGPHLMGTVEGTIPLRTTVETMVCLVQDQYTFNHWRLDIRCVRFNMFCLFCTEHAPNTFWKRLFASKTTEQISFGSCFCVLHTSYEVTTDCVTTACWELSKWPWPTHSLRFQ